MTLRLTCGIIGLSINLKNFRWEETVKEFIRFVVFFVAQMALIVSGSVGSVFTECLMRDTCYADKVLPWYFLSIMVFVLSALAILFVAISWLISSISKNIQSITLGEYELSDEEIFKKRMEKRGYRQLPHTKFEFITRNIGDTQVHEIRMRQEAESFNRVYLDVLSPDLWEKVGEDSRFYQAFDGVIVARISGLNECLCFVPKEY